MPLRPNSDRQSRPVTAAFDIAAATLLDEAAVSAVGLGNAPWKADLKTTIYGYASHLVSGGVAELVRRQARAILFRRSN